jgi:hypothetical protein
MPHAPQWSIPMLALDPGVYLDLEGCFHFDLEIIPKPLAIGWLLKWLESERWQRQLDFGE